MRPSPSLYCPLYLAFTAPFSASHVVTGSQQFVIVDSDEPQLYRLLGILPCINTLKAQIVITVLVALAVALPLLIYLVLRPRHPYADWTSQLPDSVVHLLFYVQLELSAYKNVLLSDMVSLMSTPLGIGLDIAANVSMWSPLGTRDRHSAASAATAQSSRTGRAALRRKHQNGAGLTNGASSSQIPNGHQSSHYPGLYNTGNSCFLNSTLQSLASLDVLRAYLEKVMELAETWDVPTPVTDALYDLIVGEYLLWHIPAYLCSDLGVSVQSSTHPSSRGAL